MPKTNIFVNRSLRIFAPLVQTSFSPLFMEDLSARAVGWSRTIHRDAGYLDGEFVLPGKDMAFERIMWEWIGAHFEERSGGKETWEGMIYEMDLTRDGTVYRTTLDTLANYVTARYIDENGNVQVTGAAENPDSQNKYGRKEEMLLLDGFKQAEAEGARDAYLAAHEYPQPQTLSYNPERPDGLAVKVLGYVHTAAWRYESVGDGSAGNISDYISDLITTDCEFLRVGSIASNTAQHVQKTNIPMRVFDVLRELTDVGISGAPARLYIGDERRVYYETLDLSPQYYSRDGKFYTSVGGSAEVNLWQVAPAVVRNMSYPFAKRYANSIFEDARDAYMVEVEAGDAGLYPKTELFDEGQFWVAESRWKRALRDMETRGRR